MAVFDQREGEAYSKVHHPTQGRNAGRAEESRTTSFAAAFPLLYTRRREFLHSLGRNSSEGLQMPRFTLRPPQIEDARPYLEGVAKNLATKLYGPSGPPHGH